MAMNGCDLGLAIPPVSHPVEQDGAFYGMSRLHGEPLTRALLESLPAAEQEKIADDLARFSAKFSQALGEGDRQYLGLQPHDVLRRITPDEVAAALEKPHLRDMLGEEDFKTAQQVAKEYARGFDKARDDSRVLMIHSDLHPGNILYDRAHGRLGVLDLGAGRKIEADMGFSPIDRSYPEAWTDRFLGTFGKETGIDITREQIIAKKCLYGIRHFSNPDNAQDSGFLDFFKGELQRWRDIRAENTPQQAPEAPAARVASDLKR